MPNWVMYFLFGIGFLAIVWWAFQTKAATLPSGNSSATPATLNSPGNQYGNLT